jgi:hypothetical protein
MDTFQDAWCEPFCEETETTIRVDPLKGGTTNFASTEESDNQ